MKFYKLKALYIILLIGFLVRILGISYGLPLWLVGDEPPFVLSALKMIELKTLLPVLHQQDFSAISYFPPYLSYLYVPFFLIVGLIQWIFFQGNITQFTTYLTYDLTWFFVIARLLSVLIGTLTITVVYQTAQNIFESRKTAICASLLISFSTMHVALSHFGRDWNLATFLLALAIFTLSHPNWSQQRRYISTAIIAGIAMGASIAALFIPIIMALWTLLIDKKSLKEIIFDKTVWRAIAIFAALAALSVALFPNGFFFTGANSIAVPKTFERLSNMYYSFIWPIIAGDPLIAVWAIIGIAVMLFSQNKNYIRPLAYLMLLFFNIYILVFFFAFHTGDRFAIYFYPFLALSGGYGMSWAWEHLEKYKNITRGLIIISVLIGILLLARLDWLILRNDTRMQARAWIENNISAGEKIIVLSPLTRISSTPEAITEQKNIDNKSLRKVDLAETNLPKQYIHSNQYHALNLYTVGQGAENFYQNIDEYVKKNNYHYALISDNGWRTDEQKISAKNTLISNGINIKTFYGHDIQSFDITEGSISDVRNLFTVSSFGPTVYIYQIQN